MSRDLRGRFLARTAAAVGLTLAASLSSLSPAAATAPFPARVQDGVLGVNMQNVLPLGPAKWGAYLDAAAAGGLHVVRDDASWASIEPSNPNPITGTHTYDWSRYDPWVASLAARGIRWQPILDYSAPWATSVPGNLLAPPVDPSAYATFAAAVTARYGAGGSFWTENPDLPLLPTTSYEIWNEENSPSFWGRMPCSATRYATLLSNAAAAIHRIDPAARVIVGGLVNGTSAFPYSSSCLGASDYLAAVAGADPGVLSRVQGVALHPYAKDAAAVTAVTARFRQVMDKGLGLTGLSLAVTEFGWTTGGATGTKLPETSVAGLPSRTSELPAAVDALARSNCGISLVEPHTWLTAETNPLNGEDWYGIVHNGVDPTGHAILYPSGQAYLNEVRTLEGLGTSAPDPTTVDLCPWRAS